MSSFTISMLLSQGGFVWNEFGLNHEGINAVRISSSDNPCLAHLNIDSLMSKNSNVDSLVCAPHIILLTLSDIAK